MYGHGSRLPMSKNLKDASSENVHLQANEMQQRREQRREQRRANTCLRNRKRRLDETPEETEQRSESLQVLIHMSVPPVNGENPRGANSAMNDAPPQKPTTQSRKRKKEKESIKIFTTWNNHSIENYRYELEKLKKSHAPTMPKTPSSNTPHRNEEEDVDMPLNAMAMLSGGNGTTPGGRANATLSSISDHVSWDDGGYDEFYFDDSNRINNLGNTNDGGANNSNLGMGTQDCDFQPTDRNASDSESDGDSEAYVLDHDVENSPGAYSSNSPAEMWRAVRSNDRPAVNNAPVPDASDAAFDINDDNNAISKHGISDDCISNECIDDVSNHIDNSVYANSSNLDVGAHDGDFQLTVKNVSRTNSETDVHEKCVEVEETGVLGGLSILTISGQKQQSPYLHAQRCRTCTMCQRPDCGRCSSCLFNANSTTLRRLVCVIKMCTAIPQEQKWQSIPGLRSPWGFYFSEKTPEEPDNHTRLTKLHPDLLLHVTDGIGSFHCLEEALKDRYTEKTVKQKLRNFYETHAGIPLRQVHEHALVNQPYVTQWLDSNGDQREISGEITACWKDPLLKSRGKLTFTIHYDKEERNQLNLTGTTKLQIPEYCILSEELAWCGHLAWKELRHTNVGVQVHLPSFPLSWIVPHNRSVAFNRRSAHPQITMEVNGFHLRLFAKTSGIPQAGLGLFVCIKKQRSGRKRSRSKFKLQPGELVDLGVYAPHTNEDCKTEEVVTMKNFLMQHYAECYCFDKAVGDKNDFDLFDVTQDERPALNKETEENLLAFANEPGGKTETASLVCLYDAEGAVHFLMGRTGESLELPLGKEIELKLDYETSYEKVRVRNGYSRVNKKAKQKLVEACRNADANALRDIAQWSLASVDRCLRMLEECLNTDVDRPPDFLERALTIAIVLRARVLSIEREFSGFDPSQTEEYCDNGVSSMAEDEVADRSAGVIELACNRCCAYEAGLLSFILGHEMLKEQLMECLSLSEFELKRLVLSF